MTVITSCGYAGAAITTSVFLGCVLVHHHPKQPRLWWRPANVVDDSGHYLLQRGSGDVHVQLARQFGSVNGGRPQNWRNKNVDDGRRHSM